MKLERINALTLEVSNVERSERWYRRILGLRPRRGPAADGVRELSAIGDFQLRLVSGTPLRARGFRIGIGVESRAQVRKWRAHVDASGAYANPITEQDGRYGFTVADADGYLLEFATEAPEVDEL